MRFIGSKINLLDEINNMVMKHTDESDQIFVDLFAGSNSVGQYFKKNKKIISNDILYFSYILAQATIVNNKALKFKKLEASGIKKPLEYLENTSLDESFIGYYEAAYTPSGSDNRMYFTSDNGKRIDFIRDKIDEWYENKLINKEEYFYLLASLLEGLPYVSNIAGIYGAYLKKWDKRALTPLKLKPPTIIDNKRHNKAFNLDSNELVKNIKADIIYIDTPYNGRQYAPNYHVLENIAKNDKPILKGITGLMPYSDLKSTYSMKTKALDSMEDLIKNIDSTHIILSYSTEGIINEKDLINLIKKYSVEGVFDIKRIPYRKYKSKNNLKSDELFELIIYFQKQKKKHEQINKSVENHSEIKTPTWSARTKFIKSPLNYIGGKHKILSQIIPHFPNKIDTFIDLFSGGANVGINVNANKHIFNDMNYRVNEMFRYFMEKEPKELVDSIKKKIKKYELSQTNEKAFLLFREKYNKNPNPLDLYILASYSYNYQIRFNNSMKFNNPFGRNRSSFSSNMEKNLVNFIIKLRKLDIVFTDYYFMDFDFSELTSRDFVYLDPPYLITTGNYNDGNRGFRDWNLDAELQMYSLLDEFNKKGIPFALSNVYTHKGKKNETLIEWAKAYHTHYLNHSYSNASYNTNKGNSQEVLITNY